MNKPLLLGSALLVAISAYPQNGRLKPTGVAEMRNRNINQIESTIPSSSPVAGPVKQIQHNFDAAKINVVTASKFTGSMNAFSYLVSQSKSLCYNAGVNAVTFIARKSPYYVASSNSNSGAIVASISTNLGTSWDSTVIWTSAANLGRYPQGGIYNPLGNTNKNSAYVVGMGPITGGAGWLGNWYASKTLNGAGTNTPGADMQPHLNATPTIKVHHFSRYSFTSIDGGLVRSMASVMNNPDVNTWLGAGYRGAAMVKGTFNAGAFVWSVDSFIPATTMNTGGWKNIDGTPVQAWSENGQIGYVVILGSRASETVSATRVKSTGGYQPIVYKTTNSGASWSLLPAEDFANYAKFRGVNDRMYPIETSSTTLIPNFRQNEGFDVTVDVNGDLHYVTTLVGHPSSHVDTLNSRYQFGTEQYSYGSGNFDWPIIYDFYTSSTGWKYHMVDSMYSEGPGGSTGDPGVGSNPWTNGADKVAYDARIQVSRSIDGKKIIYSWSESDTSLLGTKWNAYPDIMMRGFDVTINKVTPTYNVTGGVTGVDKLAYFHYMCNKAVGNSSVCIEIPFTTISNATNDGLAAVNTWYVKDAQLCPTNFSINPMAPTGVAENTSKTSANFDVMNFPNPANAATTILVSLKEASNFDVAIYNAVGQLVDSYKVNGHMGSNEINVDLSKFSAGVYVYNVKVGNSTVTKKLIVQ